MGGEGKGKKAVWAALKWRQSKGLGKDKYGGELVKGGYKDVEGKIWEQLASNLGFKSSDMLSCLDEV